MTTVETPTIEIPRLPDETAKAYSARVEYLTMGAGRSLDKLRQKYGKTTSSYTRQLEDWSAKYGWQKSVSDYDRMLADIAAQQHADAYRRDLEAYRDKALKAGRDLFTVAQALLIQCSRAIQGQQIEGKDGRIYTIPAMELTPTTLATASRALLQALDIEAHALRVADILPQLTEAHDGE